METLHTISVTSPLGELLGVASETGLCGLYLDAANACVSLDRWRRRYAPASDLKPGADTHPILGELAGALGAYFGGRLQRFELPLDPRGTEFQREVWRELRRIPFGQTITYGDLARRLAKPGGSRAVGSANGANPLPIVIPCHRVVASKGLGGFSGGRERKIELLRLEGVLLPTADGSQS